MVFANCLIKFAKEQSQNKERLKLVKKEKPKTYPGWEGK